MLFRSMKNGVSNVAAPSFDKVLDDPFIRQARNNNTPVRNVSSPRVTVRGAAGGNAADIAANALAGVPGVRVSTNGRRPTAAEFLRMSPRSRAAMMAGRARGVAGESRSVVVRNVARVRGAAIVRNTVRRTGSGVGVRRLPLGGGARRTTAPVHMGLQAALEPRLPSSNSSPNSGPRPVRRSSPPGAARVPRAPIPALSPRRRAALARAVRAARVAAGRNARARSGASRGSSGDRKSTRLNSSH